MLYAICFKTAAINFFKSSCFFTIHNTKVIIDYITKFNMNVFLKSSMEQNYLNVKIIKILQAHY